MRLVDADKIERELSELYKEQGWLPEDVHFSLNDVVANNWGETVEAIPVEWLKKKAQEFAERYWDKKDDRKKLILRMADCPIVIQQMIKEWRVENETD